MILLPSSLAYIERGKVSEVTSVLGGGRVLAEQFYNDNLTYVGSPCPASTKYSRSPARRPPRPTRSRDWNR